MAAIGNATKHGFLVREGDALERLAKVKRVTFDKTGTLTVGVPKVALVKSVMDKFSDEDIYAFAAAVEKYSEHPLGKAIVNCYKADKKTVPAAENFQMLPGCGVEAMVEGKSIFAGNEKLMKKAEITVPQSVTELIEKQRAKGCTVTIVAIDGKVAGFIALSDSLRAESRRMVAQLMGLDVSPVLLTGDNEAAAAQIAGEVGIRDVHANCLPEDKLRFIDEYQSKDEPVCMVGDGVNDAPALRKAMVGIAMGGVGSDIAVDAADIALVDDEVKELPHLFALSKKMMGKIKFNLSFLMLLNFVAIVLAITGVLNPVVGALVHNCGSVFVIINSAFLLTYAYKYNKN